MTARLKQSPRPSSSNSVRSCPFVERHKLVAVACEKYPELQLPDELDEWIKEIERLDDYAERMMEEVRELQKVEHRCIGTNNHRELRQTQIKIREQLRKLRISVEQKSEVNSKLERFFDEFNSRLPMVYAHVDAAEPENLTLDENRTLQTPEIKQRNYEVLQRQRDFAAEQLKIEQVYIAANEANEPGKFHISISSFSIIFQYIDPTILKHFYISILVFSDLFHMPDLLFVNFSNVRNIFRAKDIRRLKQQDSSTYYSSCSSKYQRKTVPPYTYQSL